MSISSYTNPLAKNAFLLPAAFLIIGIAQLLFGVYHGKITSAYVVDVISKTETNREGKTKTTKSSKISYTDHEGRSHQSSLGGDHGKGQNITIVYDPQKPSNVSLNSFWNIWMMPIILGIFSLPFLLFGSYILNKLLTRKAEVEYLLSYGQPTPMTIIGVNTHSHRRSSGGRNRSYSRTSYTHQLVCSAQAVGQLSTNSISADTRYISDSISGEPEDDFVGKKVNVYLNPQNPESYFVDYRNIGNLNSMQNRSSIHKLFT
jgi:hypothetical protein